MEATKALWTIPEIAAVAGTSPSAVHNWRKRYSDFPTASPNSPRGNQYDSEEVLTWLRENRPAVAGKGLLGDSKFLQSSHGLAPEGTLVVLVALLDELEQIEPERLRAATSAGSVRTLLDKARVAKGQDALDPSWEEPLLATIADRFLDSGRWDFEAEFIDGMMVSVGKPRMQGYTLPPLRSLMAILAEPQGSVLDPCAGTGSLLFDVVASAAMEDHEYTLTAADVNPDACVLLTLRLDRFFPGSRVEHADVLAHDPFSGQKFDRVLIDPPLGKRMAGSAKGGAGRSSDDFRWIEYALDHLAPGGTAVVVTTAAILSRSGADEQSRRALLRSQCIRAIITLPGLASSTNVPIAVWVLDNDEGSRDWPMVLFDASGTTSRDWAEDSFTRVEAVVQKLEELPFPENRLGGLIPAAVINSRDVRTADANLNPAYWVVRARRPDTDEAQEQLAAAVRKLTSAGTSATTVFAPDQQVYTVGQPTFQSLDRLALDGRIVIHRGSRRKDWGYAPGLIGVSDVLSGDLGLRADTYGEASAYPHTRPNDVIFVPEGAETKAVIDTLGCHVLEAPLIAIEMEAHETGFTPELLAAWLNSEEVRSLATGATLKRINMRHVTVPVFAPGDAERLTTAFAVVARQVDEAQRLLAAAEELQATMIRTSTAGVFVD